MATVPQKELRNHIGAVLRRAEAGEQITITVSGRPVAQLGPIERDTWVPSDQLQELWRLPPDTRLADELRALEDAFRDPFDR